MLNDKIVKILAIRNVSAAKISPVGWGGGYPLPIPFGASTHCPGTNYEKLTPMLTRKPFKAS